jgi:hypothetical protein
MSASANERLAAARVAVDDACQLLISPTPEQMDRCARLLESAAAELRSFLQSLRASNHIQTRAEELAETRSLVSSILRARRLLESAGAFYANWLRCLAALCGGYTGHGQPAPLERGGHFLAKG